MTDQELRDIGQEFIDNRKATLRDFRKVEVALDPVVGLKIDAEWDYIDPLRMGVWLKTKLTTEGCFTIDYSSIRAVCLNPAAFKQKFDGERAGAGDFEKLNVPEQENQEDRTEVAPYDGFDDVAKGSPD